MCGRTRPVAAGWSGGGIGLPSPSPSCASPATLSSGHTAAGGETMRLPCKTPRQAGRPWERTGVGLAPSLLIPVPSCCLARLPVQAPPSPDTGPLLKAPTQPRPAHRAPAAAARLPNPCPAAASSYPDPPGFESRYSPWPGTQAR